MEFIAKLGIVEEEADESALWLELIIENELMKRTLIEPLWNAADELVAIITSSRKSASRSIVITPRQQVVRSKIANHKSKI
jgi:four helix bundle protein